MSVKYYLWMMQSVDGYKIPGQILDSFFWWNLVPLTPSHWQFFIDYSQFGSFWAISSHFWPFLAIFMVLQLYRSTFLIPIYEVSVSTTVQVPERLIHAHIFNNQCQKHEKCLKISDFGSFLAHPGGYFKAGAKKFIQSLNLGPYWNLYVVSEEILWHDPHSPPLSHMPNIRLYWKYFQLKFDFRIHFSTIRNSIEFRISNIHTLLPL